MTSKSYDYYVTFDVRELLNKLGFSWEMPTRSNRKKKDGESVSDMSADDIMDSEDSRSDTDEIMNRSSNRQNSVDTLMSQVDLRSNLAESTSSLKRPLWVKFEILICVF